MVFCWYKLIKQKFSCLTLLNIFLFLSYFRWSPFMLYLSLSRLCFCSIVISHLDNLLVVYSQHSSTNSFHPRVPCQGIKKKIRRKNYRKRSQKNEKINDLYIIIIVIFLNDSIFIIIVDDLSTVRLLRRLKIIIVIQNTILVIVYRPVNCVGFFFFTSFRP